MRFPGTPGGLPRLPAVLAAAAALAVLAPGNEAFSHDWPMWGCNPARTGMSPMELPESLHLHWVRHMPEPRPAWPRQMDDGDKLEFDHSYSPVVADGRLFVASMVNDSLTAYDARTGDELWRYFADGPMRLAPAVWEGRVYAVSDDGRLHCVDAERGERLWAFDARPADHRVLGNERIISMWAARGGPVIEHGRVYFAAGVWPFLGTFVFSLDAGTGEQIWANSGHAAEWQEQPHVEAYAFAGIAPQGYLAVSGGRLVVSGGRSVPALFHTATGALLRSALQAKPHGGYRVRIDGDQFTDHARRYRLRDGSVSGRGEIVNEELLERVQSVEDRLDGGVFEALAANGRLYVVTRAGTIYGFGPDERETRVHEYAPGTPAPGDGEAGRRAGEILRRGGHHEGYALFLGAGDGDLLEQVAVRSRMHIVAVEPDAQKVDALRRRFAAAGLYGERIALVPGRPEDTRLPQYVFSLLVMEDPAAMARAPDAAFLRDVYDRIRPYDGVAMLRVTAPFRDAFDSARAAFDPDGGRSEMDGHSLVLVRTGPLPGSGQWTHQYGDSAHSVRSADRLVRAPFGPIWFGGPTHDNLLPRHASGPRPQVAGGRIVLLGVETLTARCVYTGRELWVREFPGIGHPFTNLDLEDQWREGKEVHMNRIPRAGATFIGSPCVTLADAVYLRYRGRVLRLDPATGDTVADWTVNPEARDGAPDWGHISVHGEVLVTTTDPHFFADGDLGRHGENAWDGTSSGRLVAMDRHTGEPLWTRDAEIGFRHNAIVSGNGRLFVNDLLSERALDMAVRRGREPGSRPLMRALDIRTGEPAWTAESSVFGTFLAYCEEHDVLLEGGLRAPLANLPDERMSLLLARRGSDGRVLWERRGRVEGPAVLHGTRVIPRPRDRMGPFGPALCLLTGDDWEREHPATRRRVPGMFWKTYGCGAMNANEHLLFYRSGAAAFADLETGMTGTLGGFRAGCTANLIPADGVLNAPDYTRTCSCSYQNQTSMGLVHMPEMEMWAAGEPLRSVEGPPLRLGINLGAPGDRRADDGTLWAHVPESAPSLGLAARILKTGDAMETGGRILSVDAEGSAATGRPGNTLDGDMNTEWRIRCRRTGRFDQALEFTMDRPVPIGRVRLAWNGPAQTRYRIETRDDGGDWIPVRREEGSGTGRTLETIEFEPVTARQVRIAFEEHGDDSLDNAGRRHDRILRVYQVRIGDLEEPDAYAYFLPKNFFRKFSLFVDGTRSPNWIAASGMREFQRMELPGIDGGGRPYTVTLHFCEPDGLAPGQRVFDIYLQGERVAEAFDIAREAGGADRAIARAFHGVRLDDSLRLELRPAPGAGHPPVLSGVEWNRE